VQKAILGERKGHRGPGITYTIVKVDYRATPSLTINPHKKKKKKKKKKVFKK
jgi:hypothetical protein